MSTQVELTSAPARRRAGRRLVGPAVALAGVALVGAWVSALPHHGPASTVVAAPVVRAAPLVGTAVPAGQQRYYAGETGALPDGGSITLNGPAVGVPAGSAATLGPDALVPVAFTVRLTAGNAPLTVSPGDFSVQIGGAQTVVGQLFGDLTQTVAGLSQGGLDGVVPTAGSSTPVTLAPGATQTLTIPFRCLARAGYVVYAPAGQPLVSWAFVAEDD